ncbi:rod shape-determining protein MreC [Methyloceanibacter sp.]|uniref:rod shape-determining protein MreC n=1 Tax=Methyloceanibacter sp. TaxID=1965321 RepID=UPI002D6F8659|nr:rod shape-determining protein MreC [Methyloceanibacter sp.]HZP10686.1 rod shape-determining protein MreC [Methyloceanibacter sp.]
MRGAASSIYRDPRRSWRRARGELLTFTLYFFCALLLVLSRLGNGGLDEARARLVDLSAPLLEAASIPVLEGRQFLMRARSYADAFREIDRLKAENEQLRQWEWNAKLLERKNARLRALLNAVDEPALHFVTGSVIADARGPFLRSALINLGRDNGVRIGYAVIDGDGLVGRTVDAGSSVTRVLLLNDLNSHIPVLVGPAGVRAMASGDNSAELRLDFLPDGATIYEGDEVYTSGSEGMLPRGLRVGTVTGTRGAFRVRPYADLGALDVVSVLFFDTPELVSSDPVAGPIDRPLSATPASATPPASLTSGPAAAPVEPAPPVNPVGAAVKHAGGEEAVPAQAATAAQADP